MRGPWTYPEQNLPTSDKGRAPATSAPRSRCSQPAPAWMRLMPRRSCRACRTRPSQPCLWAAMSTRAWGSANYRRRRGIIDDRGKRVGVGVMLALAASDWRVDKNVLVTAYIKVRSNRATPVTLCDCWKPTWGAVVLGIYLPHHTLFRTRLWMSTRTKPSCTEEMNSSGVG